MGEEKEPGDVEKDGADEKNGVGAAETLTAAFNGNESEQSNGEVDEQDAVVECSQRPEQGATNLQNQSDD